MRHRIDSDVHRRPCSSITPRQCGSEPSSSQATTVTHQRVHVGDLGVAEFPVAGEAHHQERPVAHVVSIVGVYWLLHRARINGREAPQQLHKGTIAFRVVHRPTGAAIFPPTATPAPEAPAGWIHQAAGDEFAGLFPIGRQLVFGVVFKTRIFAEWLLRLHGRNWREAGKEQQQSQWTQHGGGTANASGPTVPPLPAE